MKDIGIRELKAQASRLVRHVAETGAVYHITRHGRPAGVLAPPSFVSPSPLDGSDQAWQKLELLAAQIRKQKRSHRSALDELSRMRR